MSHRILEARSRSRSGAVAALVLALLAALPAAAVVDAHASPSAPPKPDHNPKPDARISLGANGALVGDDVYNTTAEGQARSGSARKGKSVSFGISIQNDAAAPAHLRAQAEGSAPGYKVKYLSGTTDVTADVIAGTWATGVLANGTSELLIVKISVKAAAPVGSSVSRMVTITGQGSVPLSDAVSFTAKRK